VFDLRGRFTRELIYTYKKASAHRAKCIMYNSNCFATKLTVIALLRVAGSNVHSNYKIPRTNRCSRAYYCDREKCTSSFRAKCFLLLRPKRVI